MKIEIDGEAVDTVMKSELKELYQDIKKSKKKWGKGWEKDLKAIKRVYAFYDIEDIDK